MTPGTETSEFSITKLVLYVGIGLDALAVVLEGLQNAGLHFGWLPAVLGVVGTLLIMAKALGYTSARTKVKVAALQAESSSAQHSALLAHQKVLEEARQMPALQLGASQNRIEE